MDRATTVNCYVLAHLFSCFSSFSCGSRCWLVPKINFAWHEVQGWSNRSSICGDGSMTVSQHAMMTPYFQQALPLFMQLGHVASLSVFSIALWFYWDKYRCFFPWVLISLICITCYLIQLIGEILANKVYFYYFLDNKLSVLNFPRRLWVRFQFSEELILSHSPPCLRMLQFT